MKKVVLIGDSIRMGYQPLVEKALAGIAEVWGPEENCGTTDYVLKKLDEWVFSREADVVHVNAGLHDLKRPEQRAGFLVPIERYRENLEAIFARTKAAGKTLVWATTTPVHTERHNARDAGNLGFSRREEDVPEFNRAAVEIAKRHCVPVNDLFALVMREGMADLLSQDGVHFTDRGYELLAAAVTATVNLAGTPRR
jgi:lysophospholipase L1-like esterase